MTRRVVALSPLVAIPAIRKENAATRRASVVSDTKFQNPRALHETNSNNLKIYKHIIGQNYIIVGVYMRTFCTS